MRHRLALILANTGLLAVVVALLGGPLLLGQLLGSSQTGTLGVSDAAPIAKQLLVSPNQTDFEQYASFNPSPIIESLFYQSSVTFTTFADQQAIYNGLLTVYNPGALPLTVTAETGTLSGLTEGSQVWVTLSPVEHSAVTLVTEPAAVGATELVVADAAGFKTGSLFIGDQQFKASRKSPTRLTLSEPLSKPVQVGDKVYLGAVFYNKDVRPVTNNTQAVVLPPQGRAVLTLTTVTTGGDGQAQVVLPVTIRGE